MLNSPPELFGREGFQRVQISPVVVFGFDGGFGDEDLIAKFGVRQEAAEGFQADLALADFGVAVDAGAQRSFGIVGVDNVDVGHAEHLIGAADGVAEARRAGDVEARGEQVAGVKAKADGKAGDFACQAADVPQFFEAAADVASRAGGVFEQHSELRRKEAGSGLAQTIHEGDDTFVYGSAAVTAGVEDQVLSADGGGALQFASKRFDGFGVDFRIAGGEIDQIVDVDDEWLDGVTSASGLKMPDLDRIRRAGAPHARAGRENLKGLSADFGSAQRDLFE